ncbi:MAG: DUF5658 family protein [Nitrospirota bacterium]
MYSLAEKTDRRIVSDRRKRSTPFISRHTFIGGRRKTVRRKADKKKYIFVDLYSTYLLIILLFLIVLNLCDGYFTLILIKENTVIEANPVMAFYLEYGNVSFVMLKFLINIVSLFIFCLCKNFSIARVSLVFAIIIYLSIVIYELNIIYEFYPHFFKIMPSNFLQ